MLFTEYHYRFENLRKLVQEWCVSGSIISIELINYVTFDPVHLVPSRILSIDTLKHICEEYNRIRYEYTDPFNLSIDDQLIVGTTHELCDKGVCYAMCIRFIFNNDIGREQYDHKTNASNYSSLCAF